jgi:hypothetical protein
MTEDFLHFVWKYKRFRSFGLVTTEGDALTVTASGHHNHDGGPDFHDARIRIGETSWAGHVEIHLRSSDWLKHGHHRDRAYDNVILHVVFEDDVRIRRPSGELIPTLELRGLVEPLLYQKYRSLLLTKDWVPCQAHLGSVDQMVVRTWLDRLAAERLEEKVQGIDEILAATKNSWEDVFYQRLARHFGMKVNDEPFEMLARSVPVRLLSKHKRSVLQIEALLFGQAGFLDAIFVDEYPRMLQKEYAHLSRLYNLVPLGKHTWQFLRMRPGNFPTVRIAQLAALVHRSTHLFSKIVESDNLKAIRKLFDVETSVYWLDHYSFEKPSPRRRKPLGEAAIDNILINVIAPLLFAYGLYHANDNLKARALELLQDVGPENNNVTRRWSELGIEAQNAFDSQALIRLKRAYCSFTRCLECGIGNSILKIPAPMAS